MALTEKQGTLACQTYNNVEIGNNLITLKGDKTITGNEVTRFSGEVYNGDTRIGTFGYTIPANVDPMRDPAGGGSESISVSIDNKDFSRAGKDAIEVLISAIDQFNQELEA